MEYTFEDLKKKTVAELREIAKDIEHEAVQGYSQLNKEHLLVVLCKALGIDTHKHHDVVGIDKASIKIQIRKLKKERQEALDAKDLRKHKWIIRRIRGLKREIKKAMV